MSRTRRPFVVFCGVVLVIAVLASTSGTAFGQDPNPTAEAIQTRIAKLEATLTAIAEDSGTPVAENPTFEDRGFTYTFTGAERLESLGDYADPPKGIWVAVYFTAINNGGSPASIPALALSFDDEGNFVLTDGKGRQFSLDYYGLGYSMGDYETISDLQPGIEYKSVAIFDVPKTATGFVLSLPGTNVRYRLPLDES